MIMIIDDDAASRKLISSMLGFLGYESLTCSRGREALESMNENIELILLDAMLEDMSGFSVAEEIRKNPLYANIPIIMVTILSERKDRIKALVSGANDFINKPFDMLELKVRMEALLRVRYCQNELRNSLREKELLLRELHHRVKNSFSVILSMLNIQARKIAHDETKDLLRLMSQRIMSICKVHENLYEAKQLHKVRMRSYIDNLLAQLCETYDSSGNGVAITRELDDFSLGVDKAIPLGIITTELFSNSMKHAFADKNGGCIHVKLGLVSPDCCNFVFFDDGPGGRIAPPESCGESLGLFLIDNFVKQLDGEMTVSSENGMKITIAFAPDIESATEPKVIPRFQSHK